MKVTKTVDKPSFKPITLNLTFETKEEYDMFSVLLSYDVSVPNVVFKSDKEKQGNLSELMEKIAQSL